MQEQAAREDGNEMRAREGERDRLLSELQEKHQEEAQTADAHIRAAEQQVLLALNTRVRVKTLGLKSDDWLGTHYCLVALASCVTPMVHGNGCRWLLAPF